MSIGKQILKHSAIYSAANMLSRMIGFLMIPVYTRYLTPADYGVIEILDLTVNIVSLVIGLRITAAIYRFYYQYPEGGERKALISTALLFSLGSTLAISLLLNILSPQLADHFLKSAAYTHYYRIIFITLFFQVMVDYCLVYIQIKQKSLVYAGISLSRLFLGLSLNILFVVVLKLGPMGILYSGLFTSAAVGIVLSAITFRETGLAFSMPKLKRMLGYGLPLIFSAVSTFVITFSDRYFLNYFAPLSEVGIYSLGYKFGMLISILVTGPFLSIWNPKRFEIAKDSEADRVSSKTFTYFSFATLFSGLVLSVPIKEILSVMAAPAFQGAAAVVPIVVMGYAFNAAYFHLNYAIHLKTKTRYIAYIWVSAAALDMVANYFLIRVYHGLGAAIATTLAYFYIMVLTYFVAQKLHPIRFEIGRVTWMFLMSVAVYLLSTLIPHYSPPVSLALKGLILAAFPIALFNTGFLSLDEKRSVRSGAARIRERLHIAWRSIYV